MMDDVYFDYWNKESHIIMNIKRHAEFHVNSCSECGEIKPEKQQGKEEKEDQRVFDFFSLHTHTHIISISQPFFHPAR